MGLMSDENPPGQKMTLRSWPVSPGWGWSEPGLNLLTPGPTIRDMMTKGSRGQDCSKPHRSPSHPNPDYCPLSKKVNLHFLASSVKISTEHKYFTLLSARCPETMNADIRSMKWVFIWEKKTLITTWEDSFLTLRQFYMDTETSTGKFFWVVFLPIGSVVSKFKKAFYPMNVALLILEGHNEI